MSQSQETMERSAGNNGWHLRHPGMVMSAGGRNEVKEFLGQWPLKKDADLVDLTVTLAPGGWEPADMSFSEATTKLGLIRGARWFVLRTGETTEDSSGYSLIFVTQFDGSLEKYLDDFVLNGKRNLAKVWGTCVGCPDGPDATASDIVDYIARGQIKTLACYDAYPSVSIGQIYKAADWYEKTQRFQRAVAKGDASLEDAVNTFFQELAQPYEDLLSAAVIDTEVGTLWQYDDVAENLAKGSGQ